MHQRELTRRVLRGVHPSNGNGLERWWAIFFSLLAATTGHALAPAVNGLDELGRVLFGTLAFAQIIATASRGTILGMFDKGVDRLEFANGPRRNHRTETGRTIGIALGALEQTFEANPRSESGRRNHQQDQGGCHNNKTTTQIEHDGYSTQ
jgi:hypothetical protein